MVENHQLFPKHVWSPSGGWWCQPRKWKSNTAICIAGISLIVFWVWKTSVEKEWRYNKPSGWIPSLLWSKGLKEQNRN
ncbi:hypothetical protein PNEG_00529 [Pneumocystis murina B123]|uniref:Uncharacterized protein n=1 Tax=Pneumocystis murina (strain B123) TaxID=1069680 RepID=M7NWI6_PNEMU|nr:hypothetical protein PNEG_00529 [Pneumocystis murina B123]EMR11516.1 hypothetical protein PNEG_00529 [Pneumocystis murina B123]